jgi:signal transduction histidine kinase
MKVVTTPHSVTIEISDDGVGFDTTMQGNGSGLSNLAERMQEVGGTLEITSDSATGTRLTFMISIA